MLKRCVNFVTLTCLILFFFNTHASSNPTMSNVSVLVWANEAVISLNTYSYKDYRTALQRASNYFTPKGWSAYVEALTKSKTLDTIKDNKLVVSAVATAPPVIVKQGPAGGTYSWTVDIPLLVVYENSSQKKEQKMVATLEIINAPPNVGIRGIAIVSVVMKEQSELDPLKA